MAQSVEWRLEPDARLARVLTAGIQALMDLNGARQADCDRLQLAVEGVFAYLCQILREARVRESVCAGMEIFGNEARVWLEHMGPKGDLDHFFEPDSTDKIKRTSFEALGLFLAREMSDSLVCERRYDYHKGKKVSRFTILKRFSRP
ncbi:MAG: hypothetical protein PHV85_11315 [Desulfovibrionaceae bacterium]|nr:hypothetical protein [Desulfovibrionaceae bacterium]